MHHSDEDELVGPRRGAPRPRDEDDEDLVGPRRSRGGQHAEAGEDVRESGGRSRARRSILDDDEEVEDYRPARRPRGRPGGGTGNREGASLMSMVRDVPAFLRLLGRLARDPRVSKVDKAIVAAALVYLVSPVDLIPDWVVPVVGQVEDLALLALALSRLVNNAGIGVLLDHWDGDPGSLEAALDALHGAAALLPGPLRTVLGGAG